LREIDAAEYRLLSDCTEVIAWARWNDPSDVSNQYKRFGDRRQIDGLLALIDEGLINEIKGPMRMLILTNEQLRSISKSKGLKVGGNKVDLIRRIFDVYDERIDSSVDLLLKDFLVVKTTPSGEEHANRWYEQKKEREAQIESLKDEVGAHLQLGNYTAAYEIAVQLFRDGIIYDSPTLDSGRLSKIALAQPEALRSLGDEVLDALRVDAQMHELGIWGRDPLNDYPDKPLAKQIVRLFFGDCVTRILDVHEFRKRHPSKPVLLLSSSELKCNECEKFLRQPLTDDTLLYSLPREVCNHPHGCHLRAPFQMLVSPSPGREPESSTLTPSQRLREAKRLLNDGLIEKDVYEAIYDSVLRELNS
jgi:hypothetical protein